MPFPQTDEQRELVSTVHKLLADTADPIPPSWDDRGAGLNRSLWASVASLGLLGLGVAEDVGGSGGGLRELCLVAEEIGGVCARVPFVGTAAALAAGAPDVGPIVDGLLIAVPAWETHPALPNRRSAALTLSGTTVDGSLQAVAFGMDADALLAYAGDTAVIVDLTQTGVRRHSVPAFDVTEPVAALTLRAAEAIVLEPSAVLAVDTDRRRRRIDRHGAPRTRRRGPICQGAAPIRPRHRLFPGHQAHARRPLRATGSRPTARRRGHHSNR